METIIAIILVLGVLILVLSSVSKVDDEFVRGYVAAETRFNKNPKEIGFIIDAKTEYEKGWNRFVSECHIIK